MPNNRLKRDAPPLRVAAPQRRHQGLKTMSPTKSELLRVCVVRADGATVIVLWDGRGTANDGQPYENSYAWLIS